MQEKDKKILNLQHEITELKYDLHDKDIDLREQEEDFYNKLNSLQKVCLFKFSSLSLIFSKFILNYFQTHYLSKDEFKMHKEFLVIFFVFNLH